MKTWKDTAIWKSILDIPGTDADDVKSFLLSKGCMDKIEKILTTGGTSPKDFTLHDADHSFRVTQRMWQIIPDQTKSILSKYELAFLLMSAYLHDIGMTPDFKKVDNHHKLLTTDQKYILSVSERDNFQRWIDDEGYQLDLENEVLQDSEKAAEIVMFYSRHKHNDWSESWIRDNFNDVELGNYTNWLNDIVDICKSHHHGLAELKTEKFEPIRINTKIVHRRYVAMCLRLADVIEIDPERAPDVLLKHRSVTAGSLSHWLKEKFTSVEIINGCISIVARPTQAFIHKAVDDVADQIERETNLCNILISERPLHVMSPSHGLAHHWTISPSVHRDIQSAGNYEFINGTFRPNSNKLLQLLAGTELYGSPLLAIKELIQNSLDAVKVQLAYKIIEDKLSNYTDIDAAKRPFSITLQVKEDGEDIWILCKDNGVGMDKEIIKQCFLVGGSTKRHEIYELERYCKGIGYDLGLTGKFGIGVLSYFMIADNMIINTKKSVQSGCYEKDGWQFQIGGLNDFGELRRIELKSNGTEIKLRIRKELIPRFREKQIIVDLLDEILIRVPCDISFIAADGQQYLYKSGWCRSQEFILKHVIDEFHNSSNPRLDASIDFATEVTLQQLARSGEIREELQQRVSSSIELISWEGKLSGHNGYIRIHIPLFKNHNGDSFAFFFENSDNKSTLHRLANGFAFLPTHGHIKLGWKGISTKTPFPEQVSGFTNCYVELDLTESKSYDISVSRLAISLKRPDIHSLLADVRTKIDALILSHKDRLLNSKYSLQNSVISRALPVNAENMWWAEKWDHSKNLMAFEPVRLPLLVDVSYDEELDAGETYMDGLIYKLRPIYCIGPRDPRIAIERYFFKFNRVVIRPDFHFRLAYLITDPTKNEHRFNVRNSADFPPGWEQIICVRGYAEEDIVLNQKCPYSIFYNDADFNLVENWFDQQLSLDEQIRKTFTDTKSMAVCFIMNLIKRNVAEYWNGLVHNNHNFVKLLWNKIFDDENAELLFFFDGVNKNSLICININSWVELSRKEEIENKLPALEKEWCIDDAHRMEQKNIIPVTKDIQLLE